MYCGIYLGFLGRKIFSLMMQASQKLTKTICSKYNTLDVKWLKLQYLKWPLEAHSKSMSIPTDYHVKMQKPSSRNKHLQVYSPALFCDTVGGIFFFKLNLKCFEAYAYSYFVVWLTDACQEAAVAVY